jgi:polysaccharide export outer membrane protein
LTHQLTSNAKDTESAKGTDLQAPKDYVLGPDDQISIWVADCPDISAKTFNIDTSGYINLPFVGVVRASGLTARQFESQLSSDLKRYFVRPQVAVSIVEFRSQPVSVIGEVNQPGVHQLRGHKTLVEVLSMAGGLKPEAGYKAKITRESEWGPIPLPDAKSDPSGNFSVAEVKLNAVLTSTSPEENILVRPNDVIYVPRAPLVYVMGEVMKAGGFVLSESQTISVLRVLSLAGGLGPQAAPQNARILREKENGTERTEVAVNVKEILAGKGEDVGLKSNDILFIPNSLPKKAALRIAETALQVGTGIAIYGTRR